MHGSINAACTIGTSSWPSRGILRSSTQFYLARSTPVCTVDRTSSQHIEPVKESGQPAAIVSFRRPVQAASGPTERTDIRSARLQKAESGLQAASQQAQQSSWALLWAAMKPYRWYLVGRVALGLLHGVAIVFQKLSVADDSS